MTSPLFPGRRWASALAASVLCSSLLVPGIALSATPATEDVPGRGCGAPEGRGGNPGRGNGSERNDRQVGNVCDPAAPPADDEASTDAPEPSDDDLDEVEERTDERDRRPRDVRDRGERRRSPNPPGRPVRERPSEQEDEDEAHEREHGDHDDHDRGDEVDDQNDGDAVDDQNDGDEVDDRPNLPEVCAGPLVSFTPAGTVGNDRAVMLTSQAFEQGDRGWGHVSWEAAAGTTVHAVSITREGDVTTLDNGDLSKGTALDVDAIAFCGESRQERDLPDAPEDVKRAPEEEQLEGGDPELDEATSVTDPSPGGRTPSTQPTTAAEPPVPTEVAGVTLRRPAADAQAGEVEVASDTQVLGVTLSRTGADLGGLAAGGAVGLLAGGLVLLGTRRRETDEVAS
jgi:hypothetical protein